MYKYFEDTADAVIKFYATSLKSKGLSNEKISSVTGFTRLYINYENAIIKLKFDGSILMQNVPTSIRSIANFNIVYRLIPRTNNSIIVLENCLFGKIKITENTGTDKYKYLGYCILFN